MKLRRRKLESCLEMSVARNNGRMVFKTVQYYGYNYNMELKNGMLTIFRRNKNKANAESEIFLTVPNCHIKDTEAIKEYFELAVQHPTYNWKEATRKSLTQKLWNRLFLVMEDVNFAWDFVEEEHLEAHPELDNDLENKEVINQRIIDASAKYRQEEVKEEEIPANKVELKVYDVRTVAEKSVDYKLPSSDWKVNNPQNGADVINKALQLDARLQEVLGMITVNVRYEVTGIFQVTSGGLSSSYANPREVFQRAVLQGAHAILLFHNHPSGSLKPSSDDIQITRKMVEAGEILGIEVIDHIIISSNPAKKGYTSFKEEGVM